MVDWYTASHNLYYSVKDSKTFKNMKTMQYISPGYHDNLIETTLMIEAEKIIMVLK